MSERKAGVGAETLVVEYGKAVHNKESMGELATRLDMNEDSLRARVSTLRSEMRIADTSFQVGDKVLKGEDIAKLQGIKLKDVKGLDYKIVTPGFELPQLSGGASKSRVSKVALASLAQSIFAAQAETDEDSDEQSEDSTEVGDEETDEDE